MIIPLYLIGSWMCRINLKSHSSSLGGGSTQGHNISKCQRAQNNDVPPSVMSKLRPQIKNGLVCWPTITKKGESVIQQ